jgi:hypothetical protein
MMEAVQTSETLVHSYQSTRRYNPEDSHLHTDRRENFKSYFIHYLLAKRLSRVEIRMEVVMTTRMLEHSRKSDTGGMSSKLKA